VTRARRPTLPPWSLPSPLAPRFVLIACAVLAAAMVPAEVVASHVITDPPAPGEPCWPVWRGIQGQGPLALPALGDPTWPDAYWALLNAYPDCFRRPYPDLPLAAQHLAGLALVGACLAAYLAWPAWRIARQRLVPAEPLPGVGERLRELSRLAGARVRFVADLRSRRASGLAFGHAGRRYVLINRGLIGVGQRDPATFRAIVAHELAHVRNRDIDVAYLTVALWRVFLAAFVVPALLLFGGALDAAGTESLTGESSGRLATLWQLALLAVLVLLNHHAVLREREWRPTPAPRTGPAPTRCARSSSGPEPPTIRRATAPGRDGSPTACCRCIRPRPGARPPWPTPEPGSAPPRPRASCWA